MPVRIDIDHDVSAVCERRLNGIAECFSNAAVDTVGIDEIRTGLSGDGSGLVSRSVVDDLHEYLVDASQDAWNPSDGIPYFCFFIESRQIDYESHRFALRFKAFGFL